MIEKKIALNFKNKKCLVTGGTGLIGRQVVKILCGFDAIVKIVSLDEIKIDERAKHINADLTNLDVCKDVTNDIDYVFHLAGIKGSIEVTKAKPASFFVPLIMFNTNILEASRINNVRMSIESCRKRLTVRIVKPAKAKTPKFMTLIFEKLID